MSIFIQTHTENSNGGINLTFVKSGNITVFPCGKRRSPNLSYSENSNINIPFDPEARLNTEANNRKHSSLNGFSQTFLNTECKDDAFKDNIFSVVLAGYLFNIQVPDGTDEKLNKCNTPNEFATAILTALYNSNEVPTDVSKIYANIRIENVTLFEAGDNFIEYKTSVLRNQSDTKNPIELDQVAGSNTNPVDIEKYYFSGLSFSTTPLTGDTSNSTYSIKNIPYSDTESSTYQQVISLCVLNKVEDSWKLFNPAKIPQIVHGENDNSLELGGISIDNGIIRAEDIYKDKLHVAAIQLQEVEEILDPTGSSSDTGTETIKKYQLKILSNNPLIKEESNEI